MVKRDISLLMKNWKRFVGDNFRSEEDELVYIMSLKKIISWSEFHDLYLMTQHWQNLRKVILIRDKVCVSCGSDRGLSVDHKTYKRLGCEELEDLQVLCWLCHRNKTKRFDFGANEWYHAQARRKVDVVGKNLFQVRL